MRMGLRCNGKFYALAFLLSVRCLAPGRLSAQGATSATVLGTVTDAAGAVVPNASIQVKNTGTGQVQQAPTDGQGRYAIAELPVGNYDATATANGFQTTIRRNITLTVGAQAVVDFQ